MTKSQACLDRFKEALEDCDLHDLGFTGEVFTWRNKQFREADYIRERLDRAVANGAWRECYPLVHVKNGDPFHSDHRLVVIFLEGDRGWSSGGRRESGFKFEASWLKEDMCGSIVSDAWAEGDVHGGGSIVEKLKNVAGSLQVWSVNVRGDLDKRIKKIKKELESCRRLPTNNFSVQREAVLSYRLDKVEEQVDVFWRQRAHANWLEKRG
jgi:hypothetical protein